jgi:hypothetical protein
MGRVSEKHVGLAVTEVERGSEDPQHVAAVVGAFMQRQPMIGHYVQAHTSDVGLEGMVLVLLHASVVARAVELAAGRTLKPVVARELDAAASAPASGEKAFAADEPELVAYLDGNIPREDPTIGGKKRPIAMSLLRVIARAILSKLD